MPAFDTESGSRAATPPAPSAPAAEPAAGAPPLVVPLDAVVEGDRARVGGKAFRLGRARAAGFPVPEGFVVTTDAFRAWLAAPAGTEGPPLGATIRALLEEARDPRRLAGTARAIEARLAAAPLPAALAAAVRGSLEGLAREREGAPAVAVRSSALGEDGAVRSLAGHFDSFLDVRGEAAVLDALRRCFASAYSERALAARLRDAAGAGGEGGAGAGAEGASGAGARGTPGAGAAASPAPCGEPVEMAVLVQRMVRGGPGGVLFTRDPGGAVGRMLCELHPEGAEGVAGGQATPHRIAIERASGRIVEGASGARGEAALAQELARLGARLEERFDGPQDVEWARGADGRVALLQTRPITLAPREKALDRWTAANSQEALEDPVTPLTYTFLEPWIERGRRLCFRVLGVEDPPGRYMRLFDGRIYFNVDYFRRFLERVPGAPPEVFDLLIFGEMGEIALPFPPPFAPRLLLVAREAWRAWSYAIPRMDLFVARLSRKLRALARRDLSRPPDEGLLRHLDFISRLSEKTLYHHVLGTAMAGGHYLVLQKFLRHCGLPLEESAADELLAGAPGIETARSSAAIFELARLAGRLPEVRAALLAADPATPGPELRASLARLEGGAELEAALASFLEEFGHRSEREAELMRPRWAEDPGFVLRAARHFVELGVGGEGGARLRSPLEAERALASRGRRLSRRIERALLASGPLGGAKRALFRFLLRWAERAAPYRENLRFHALRGLAEARRGLLEVGRRLAARGALEAPGDVFFLEAGEAFGALRRGAALPEGERAALRARVRERRADHERALEKADVPKLLYDDGSLAPLPPRAARAAGRAPPPPPLPPGMRAARMLAGVAVSSGVVTGRARRVERLEDGWSLGPDEILLARAATPSWTPLFFFAKGVILDIGGMLSHCAVIAREYGIPCVVGCKTATAEVPDGASVTLDADHGRVYLLESDASSPPTPSPSPSPAPAPAPATPPSRVP
jgi:pyruvate,water dikinase